MSIAAVNANKTTNIKSHLLLGYADDIDIIGQTLGAVIEVFSETEKEPGKILFGVDEDKTKLVVSKNRNSSREENLVNIIGVKFYVSISKSKNRKRTDHCLQEALPYPFMDCNGKTFVFLKVVHLY